MSDLSDRLARLSPAKRALFERMAASSAAPPVIPRRAVRTPAPLSFAQERLWFLHCLDPDSPAYGRYALSHRGPPDRTLVERGWFADRRITDFANHDRRGRRTAGAAHHCIRRPG